VTIGTLDGANVEILEEVGEENIFIFGLKSEEVEERRRSYNPWDVYNNDDEIRRAFTLIEKDFFSLLEPGIFKPILQSLLEGGDHYMLLADMRDYIQTQERVDAAYRDQDAWDRMAILNVARAGKFSSSPATERSWARRTKAYSLPRHVATFAWGRGGPGPPVGRRPQRPVNLETADAAFPIPSNHPSNHEDKSARARPIWVVLGLTPGKEKRHKFSSECAICLRLLPMIQCL
jgi:hypothetical protein